MVIQNLGGGGGGGERCITVDVKVVNCFELQIIPSRFFASLARASKQPIKKQEIITRMHSVVRKIQIKLDLTGIYAQLFSLRRKTRKYTTLRIVFVSRRMLLLSLPRTSCLISIIQNVGGKNLAFWVYYMTYTVTNQKAGRGRCQICVISLQLISFQRQSPDKMV